MTVRAEGLDETRRVVSRLPDDLQTAADASLGRFVTGEISRIRGRAGRVSRQAALAARSVTGQGRTIIGANGAGVAAAIFYGAEFGGRRRRTTQQFQPFRGQRGYFMFPQLAADEDRLDKAGLEAADKIIDEWED